MKIATWNINSVRLRIEMLARWLQDNNPDVLALQEIKCTNEQFPKETLEDLGYYVHVHGQKSYNGVALLTKTRPEEIVYGLPTMPEDEQARYIEVSLVTEPFGMVRIGGLYCPNGNPAPGPKYDYKLTWMEALKAHAAKCLANDEHLILLGDYNVITDEQGCYKPEAWRDDALYLPSTRHAFQALMHLGLTDALAIAGQRNQYTFWDYQGGAWPKNQGIRIDHLLLSSGCVDLLSETFIDKAMRAQEKPSDHVPVMAIFA